MYSLNTEEVVRSVSVEVFHSYFAYLLQNKVTSMTFLTGKAVEDLCRIKQVNILTADTEKLLSFFVHIPEIFLSIYFPFLTVDKLPSKYQTS